MQIDERLAEQAEITKYEHDKLLSEIEQLKKEINAKIKRELTLSNEEADKEIEILRRMLCINISKQPYLDDGEMQDNSTFPHIDFKRDSISAIKRKLFERAENKIKEVVQK